MKVRNTFIIFVVSGFWHGANWTFIVWGALNALYFLPLLLAKKNRSNLDIAAKGKLFPSIKTIASIFLTFSLTVLAWIFFRAESVSHAISYITEIGSSSLLTLPEIRPTYLLFLIAIFMTIEWLGREGQYALEKLALSWRKPFRYVFYYALIFAIFYFVREEQQFIYFQF